MKKLFLFSIPALMLFSCTEKKAVPKKDIHNEMFNWTISIPENFENVPPEQWDKIQQRGKDAVEKAYGGEVQNNSKTIFVFRNQKTNYFESNWQPFDTAKDGNYDTACQAIYELMYTSFVQQMPDSKIDTASSKEIIDGLEFKAFKVTVSSKDFVMTALNYSHLFDKKDLTVDIIYMDKAKGDAMLDAWRNSKFSDKQ